MVCFRVALNNLARLWIQRQLPSLAFKRNSMRKSLDFSDLKKSLTKWVPFPVFGVQ